jgi:hypothetical protein
MKASKRLTPRKMISIVVLFLLSTHVIQQSAGAYMLGSAVADMRDPASTSGGTSCPQLTRFNVSQAGSINHRWSLSLGTDPVTILTVNQNETLRAAEIESTIDLAFGAWTGVPATSLTPASLSNIFRTPTTAACSSSDGINTICFNQTDPSFTAGVLAFTRVVSADTIGEQLSSTTPPSTFVGEILDADILVRPDDATTQFATPAALSSYPTAYDLESILTHEVGHFFGFSHSAVWSAMMFPFAPPEGQFTAPRPTAQSPDAPLADDDRTGLRILYPDPSDTTFVGSISGRILPANPLALPYSPQIVTGIFPAQVVAVDTSTGNIVAAPIAGWSCSDPGPAQFNGSYSIQHLPVGASQSYQIYAEPLDGPVTPADVFNSSIVLCRSNSTDPGWPAQFECTVPSSPAPFSARILPGP